MVEGLLKFCLFFLIPFAIHKKAAELPCKEYESLYFFLGFGLHRVSLAFAGVPATPAYSSLYVWETLDPPPTYTIGPAPDHCCPGRWFDSHRSASVRSLIPGKVGSFFKERCRFCNFPSRFSSHSTQGTPSSRNLSKG